MRKINGEKVCRIIDANLNRAREGLRVCEDIARFIFDKRNVTAEYKKIRHHLAALGAKENLIGCRNIQKDVGKKSTSAEFRRGNVRDIFYANSQRVKESVRVLEEFTKLSNRKRAEQFKKLRYRIYALEKNIAQRF